MNGEFSVTRGDPIVVGGPGNWSFRYTAGNEGLNAGTKLVLVVIGGRDLKDFSCETPLASLLSVEPAEIAGPVEVAAERWDGESSLQFTFELRDDLAAGTPIDLTLGSDDAGTFAAQRYAQQFTVKIACLQVADEQPIQLGGDVQIAIVGSSVEQWKANASSNIEPGSTCEVRVTPLDRFSNQADSGVAPTITLTRRAPAAGSAVSKEAGKNGVAEFQVPEPGVYEISISGSKGETQPVSNVCVAGSLRPGHNIYWGDLHCKSRYSDGARSVQECLEYARDTARLDFAAVTDHEAPACYLNDTQWYETQQTINKFNDPRRFATILGYEWSGSGEEWFQGHLCVYFRGGSGTLLRSEISEFSTAAQLMRALEGKDAFVVPHHPAGPLRTHTSEWPVVNDTAEPLVEMYSKWGSYETPTAPLATKGGRRKAYVLNALRRGHRLGFVGGSNSHYGMPGSDVDETPRDKLTHARSGITAVFSRECTREAIFDALRARRCYATTGAPIVADFSVNGELAGGQITIHREQPRQLSVEVHGTAPIDRVDIIRNESVVHTVNGSGPDMTFDWADDPEIPTILVNEPGGYSLFAFYYVRVCQTDGHIAWLSPVRLACTTH